MLLSKFKHVYEAFQQTGIDDPLLETLRLFDLLSNGALCQIDHEVPSLEQLVQIVSRRSAGLPIEYILGKTVFMGLQLECTPAALIPRKETELLVRTTLNLISRQQAHQPRLTVVDMGTGSGNIAVSLAVNTSDVHILACDVSTEAVELAKRQVANFGLQERVTLLCGDLYEPLQAAGYAGTIDILVCNPPYLPTGTLARLAREIIDHEPVVALDAGPYGLNIYRRLITGAGDMLRPDGAMVFEIGAGQERLVTRLIEGIGIYPTITHHRDGDGQIRVITADRRPTSGHD